MKFPPAEKLCGVLMELNKKKQIVEYCLKHEQFQFMWAATILSILFDCDFREAEQKARAWLEKGE